MVQMEGLALHGGERAATCQPAREWPADGAGTELDTLSREGARRNLIFGA
jgi:hypothetical protein